MKECATDTLTMDKHRIAVYTLRTSRTSKGVFTLDHLDDQMNAITRQVADTKRKEQIVSSQLHKETAIATREVKQLLQNLGHHLAATDDNLAVLESDNPGIQVHYIKSGMHNPEPFNVTATCTGNQVEVQVSDGKWQNIPNTSGNWGHWSDSKVLYSGDVDEEKITDVVSKAFINWYESSLH